MQYYDARWIAALKDIGKVFLSFFAFLVGALLGEIIGHYVLNLTPDPKSLTATFIFVLIFPIWYSSRILLRIVAVIVGPIFGFFILVDQHDHPS